MTLHEDAFLLRINLHKLREGYLEIRVKIYIFRFFLSLFLVGSTLKKKKKGSDGQTFNLTRKSGNTKQSSLLKSHGWLR